MKYLLFIVIFIIQTNAIELQKANTYDKNKHSIKNWYMSEKLDGIRAYWNGFELISKNGNKIHAPKWFTKDFPNFELDGELWTKRNDFENIQSIVLDKTPSLQWNKITYNIFEVPKAKGNFIERLKKIKTWNKKHKHKYIQVISQTRCKDKKHLEKYLLELIELKAEGIIIKNPNNIYKSGRSSKILKVKKFQDMEGLVLSYNYNKDKFKSLKVKIKSGIIFNLGNGFTKIQKKNPPKIGEVITFKYYNLTKYGKPKFASFLRVRKKE